MGGVVMASPGPGRKLINVLHHHGPRRRKNAWAAELLAGILNCCRRLVAVSVCASFQGAFKEVLSCMVC